jgi:hypothetical protein
MPGIPTDLSTNNLQATIVKIIALNRNSLTYEVS